MKKKRCGHVERRKLNKIELELAWKGICGNKKEAVEIFILFAAAFFMIQSIFIMTDSIKKAIQDDRTARYGAWEYCLPASEADASVKESGTCGTVFVIGQVISDGQSESASIGYYGEQAAGLAKLTLLEGRMPQAPDEVAVEAETMSALGLPYETGVRITASIGVKQTAADGSVSYHYPNGTVDLTVCGILKPYSSGWVTAGKVPIPQIIAFPGAQEFLTSGRLSENYILFLPDKAFPKGDLSDYPNLLRNTKAYPENPYEALDGVLRLLSWSGALISACVISLTVSKNIRSQRDSIDQFALLGARPSQIRLIILWQCFFYLLAGMPAGLLLGIASGAGLIKLCSSFIGYSLPIRLLPSAIAGSLLMGLGVSLAGSIFAVLVCRGFSVGRSRVRRKVGKRQRQKKGYRRNKLPVGIMLLKSFTDASARSFLFILISAMYLASMLVIFDRLKESVSLYQYGEQLKYDYVLSYVSLTDYQIQKLESVPGVEKVEAVRQDDFFLELEDGGYDEYFKVVKDWQKSWRIDGIEEKEVQVSVTGFTRTSENDEILQEEYGLSEEETERFYQGDFICIFLPELYVGGEPPVALAATYPGYFSNQLPTVKTEAVRPGSRISLSYPVAGPDGVKRETKELTVGATLSTYRWEMSDTNIETGAYGITMSAALMDSYETFPGKGRYQNVLVMANDSATYEATDKAVSAFHNSRVSGAFVNRRILLQERFRQMLTDMAGLIFIAVLFTLLLIFILYHLSVYETERRKARISLLGSLGIGTWGLWRLYLAGGIGNGILCTGAGILFYLAYILRKSVLEAAETFVYPLEMRFWQNLQGTSLTAFFLLSGAFLVLSLLLHCMPACKFLLAKTKK